MGEILVHATELHAVFLLVIWAIAGDAEGIFAIEVFQKVYGAFFRNSAIEEPITEIGFEEPPIKIDAEFLEDTVPAAANQFFKRHRPLLDLPPQGIIDALKDWKHILRIGFKAKVSKAFPHGFFHVPRKTQERIVDVDEHYFDHASFFIPFVFTRGSNVTLFYPKRSQKGKIRIVKRGFAKKLQQKRGAFSWNLGPSKAPDYNLSNARYAA